MMHVVNKEANPFTKNATVTGMCFSFSFDHRSSIISLDPAFVNVDYVENRNSFLSTVTGWKQQNSATRGPMKKFQIENACCEKGYQTIHQKEATKAKLTVKTPIQKKNRHQGSTLGSNKTKSCSGHLALVLARVRGKAARIYH